MTKSNIRSFRYSDKVREILESCEGLSLNEKFENLVFLCFCKVEQREKDLLKINEEIVQQRKKLYDFQKQVSEINQLIKDLESAKFYLGIVSRRAQGLAEECNTN